MKLQILFIALCLLSSLLFATDVQSALKKLAGNDSARGAGREELKDMFANATAPSALDGELPLIEQSVVSALKSGTLPLSEQLYLFKVLGLYGSASTADVVYPFLEHKNEEVRDSARRALVQIPGEKALNHLLSGLEGASGKELGAFVDALATRGDVAAVERLTGFLSSKNEQLVQQVALALGKLKSKSASPALLSAHLTASLATKLEIERALLDIGLDSDSAYKLAGVGSSSVIRANAFSQLLELDQRRALQVLNAVIEQPEFSGRTLFFEQALNSTFRDAQDAVVAHLPKAAEADQAIIITAIGENAYKQYEPDVLAFIHTDSWSLRMDVIHTLGNIGSDVSLNPLLNAFLGDPKNTTIANAVARLKAPSADSEAFSQVKDGGSADTRIASMKVLQLRNTKGATELLNSIVQYDNNLKVREAAISTLESIGNIDTIQIFITMVLNEDPIARKVQRSLKRLSLNFGAPDYQWEKVYKPALDGAPSDQARESVVLIMDGVESQLALNYLERNILDVNSSLRAASLKTLQRYSNMDSAEKWIRIASIPDASDAVIKSAQRSISKILKSNDWHDSWKRVDIAVKAIEEVPNVEFKNAILEIYKSPPAPQKKHVKDKFKALRNDPDVGAAVTQILNSL